MTLQANDLPSSLTLECTADAEWQNLEAKAAAAGEQPKIPTFTIKAYTGGPMQVGGFYRPVVVDLAGMKVAAKAIPILRGHDDGKIIGHGTVTINAKDIDVSGVVSVENRHSREVVSSARNKFPWQASIGASVVEFENVRDGQSVSVNGSTIKGPVLVARKSVLNEVSFVPRGADSKTSVKVAASAISAKPVTLAQLHSRRKTK